MLKKSDLGTFFDFQIETLEEVGCSPVIIETLTAQRDEVLKKAEERFPEFYSGLRIDLPFLPVIQPVSPLAVNSMWRQLSFLGGIYLRYLDLNNYFEDMVSLVSVPKKSYYVYNVQFYNEWESGWIIKSRINYHGSLGRRPMTFFELIAVAIHYFAFINRGLKEKPRGLSNFISNEDILMAMASRLRQKEPSFLSGVVPTLAGLLHKIVQDEGKELSYVNFLTPSLISLKEASFRLANIIIPSCHDEKPISIRRATIEEEIRYSEDSLSAMNAIEKEWFEQEEIWERYDKAISESKTESKKRKE